MYNPNEVDNFFIEFGNEMMLFIENDLKKYNSKVVKDYSPEEIMTILGIYIYGKTSKNDMIKDLFKNDKNIQLSHVNYSRYKYYFEL